MYKVSMEILIKSRDLLEDLISMADPAHSNDIDIIEAAHDHIKLLNDNYICLEQD